MVVYHKNVAKMMECMNLYKPATDPEQLTLTLTRLNSKLQGHLGNIHSHP